MRISLVLTIVAATVVSSSYSRNAAAQEPLVGTFFRFWEARLEGLDRSEPLVTDRPDFTEASSVVGLGFVQLESGYTYVYKGRREDGSATRTHGGPEALWRIGLWENVELRFVWNYLWQSTNDMGMTTNIDGAQDIQIGAKLYLIEQIDWLPEQSLIVQSNMPTGARAFTNEDPSFGLNWLYAWEMPAGWSLAGSTGFDTATEDIGRFSPATMMITPDRDRHLVWHQSVAAGLPITEKLGAYFEYFGLYTSGRAPNFSQNFINGGFAYILTNDIQLDIRAGHGLNLQADDFFGGAGITIRM